MPPRARPSCRQSIIPSSNAPRSPGCSARLSGIDFRLYDPNQLHPDADRLSFVFLETEAAPFLDGRLVQVDRGKDHEAEIIREAAFYLRGPKVHLHAYLDDWIDLLFSWVKYFFVGDLWWRRFEDMQGYEDYREVFSDVQNTMGTERAEQATFDAILATFTQHAEHWTGKVAASAAGDRRSASRRYCGITQFDPSAWATCVRQSVTSWLWVCPFLLTFWVTSRQVVPSGF